MALDTNNGYRSGPPSAKALGLLRAIAYSRGEDPLSINIARVGDAFRELRDEGLIDASDRHYLLPEEICYPLVTPAGERVLERYPLA